MMASRRTTAIAAGMVALLAVLLLLAACASPSSNTTSQRPPASTSTSASEEASENDSIQTTSEEGLPNETSGSAGASAATGGATGSTVLGRRIYTTGTDQAGKIKFTGGTQALQQLGVAPCIRCHGQSGQGVQGQGPNLAQAVQQTFNTQQLFDQAVKQGNDEQGQPLGERMPRYDMSSEDLIALYTYVRTFK